MIRKTWIIMSIFFCGCITPNNVSTSKNRKSFRSCPQTVTVFTDEISLKKMKTRDITILEILSVANQKFSRISLNICYDLNSIKTKEWDRKKIADWGEGSPRLRKRRVIHEIRKEMADKIAEEDSDIIIFIAGDLLFDHGIAGLRPWYTASKYSLSRYFKKQKNGNGIIILGTGALEFTIFEEELLDNYSNIILNGQGYFSNLRR